MKILIVEDDPVAQLLLKASLVALAYEVVVRGDGEEAWTALQADDIRLIVSDWMLPKCDGLELCRKVRARGGAYVYFILLTQQSANELNTQTALDAGVDDFLTKPVDLRELRLRLHVARRILDFTTQVSQLESILPICGYCKKIRDDQNSWHQVEQYIESRTGTGFSHGVCPDCYKSQMIPMLLEAGVPESSIPRNLAAPPG